MSCRKTAAYCSSDWGSFLAVTNALWLSTRAKASKASRTMPLTKLPMASMPMKKDLEPDFSARLMDMLAIFCASSPMRSRSVMVLIIAMMKRRSPAAGWRRANTVTHSSSMDTSQEFSLNSFSSTVSASSTSNSPRARKASLSCRSASPPMSNTAARILSKSLSNCREMCCAVLLMSHLRSHALILPVSVAGFHPLTIAPGNVVLGHLLLRVGEQRIGVAKLD